MMYRLLKCVFKWNDIKPSILFSLVFILLAVEPVVAEKSASLQLHKGLMANYGATPWFTTDITIGENQLKLGLDTGGNFIWATSSKCKSEACNVHQKVDTKQPHYQWKSKDNLAHSFGPWGTMLTRTGEIGFSLNIGTEKDVKKKVTVKEPFYASIHYAGNKFNYMDWDGGIAFPSDSRFISGSGENRSGFLFKTLLDKGLVAKPFFSVLTDSKTQKGWFYLGRDNSSSYRASSEIILPPNTSGPIKYLWGTSLYEASLGKTDLPLLKNARFYLDSGSSLFKGDSNYLMPIIQALYELNDTKGQRIFDKIIDENGVWIGLVYANGRKPDATMPKLKLSMGTSCAGMDSMAAEIWLSPEQYSYYVEEGEQKGNWVAAFTVLDGVGGILVGSTFMDLFYTRFEHQFAENGTEISQGNMYLYQKNIEEAEVQCKPIPAASQVFSPLSGVWYNSFCSQVELAVYPGGKIKGVYTSHTGSTGSSTVVGYVGKSAGEKKGTPVSLAIQWRPININISEREKVSEVESSWHWMSNLAGQYNAAQTISVQGQAPYSIDETLYLLNELYVTTQDSYRDGMTKILPQNLTFTKTPPSYCKPIAPPAEKPYQPSANDLITGKWKSAAGETLHIRVNPKDFNVSGKLSRGKKKYQVLGLADPIQGSLPKVQQQGVSLVLKNELDEIQVLVGGVHMKNIDKLTLWKSDVQSTSWTDRYQQLTIDKQDWTRE